MTFETAALFGAIFVTFISAATVVCAFLRPMIRFANARLQNHAPSFPDRLCAGIWTSAVGAMVMSAVSMVRLWTGSTIYWLAILAWVGIALGYSLHFTAWRASFVGQETGFTWRYTGLLVGLGALVIWICLAVD